MFCSVFHNAELGEIHNFASFAVIFSNQLKFIFYSLPLMKIFPNRDLIALSATELLVEPTHYPNDKEHVSDTHNTKPGDGLISSQFPDFKIDQSSAKSESKSTRTDL